MYTYCVIYRNKSDGTFLTLPIVAFTRADLMRQIATTLPLGYTYVRYAQARPGDRTLLNPVLGDMRLCAGGTRA